MKRIIVLAGSLEQFERYMRSKSLTDNREAYIYTSRPHNIYSVEAKRVDIIGTFWERDDAIELEKLAKSRIR